MNTTKPGKKTIIAGSRTITQTYLLERAIKECGWEISAVLCGCAAGVDTLGYEWAQKNNIPILSYPARWDVHGKAAGPIRNEEMAKDGDALIALWDGESRGTRHMCTTMRSMKKSYYVAIVKNGMIEKVYRSVTQSS